MTAAPGGTQSIERSIRIMRALAARARFGWRLSDLARHCEIDKGTARRILTCLVRERLAERSTTDQRYLPGPLLFELGLALPDHDEFKTTAYPLLERLAALTGTVAFLCLRSGDELVCAARVGEVRDHAFTLNIGTRRPLGGSSAGMAILIHMPEDERNAVYERNRKALAPGCSDTQDWLERMFRRSLEAGIGINESNLVPGWNSYAVAVFNPQQQPFAAVMVSAPSANFSAPRLEATIAAMHRVARQLQEISEAVFGKQRRPDMPANLCAAAHAEPGMRRLATPETLAAQIGL